MILKASILDIQGVQHNTMHTSETIAYKECREDLFAVRGMGLYLTAAIVLSAFSLLMISNTELSLLDNAQAVYMMAGIVLALAGLIAIVKGSDSFAGERDRETLEALLITPASRLALSAGKLIAIFITWFLLYLLAVPYLWAVGSSGQNLAATFVYLLGVGSLLVIFFASLILSLSARIRSFKGTISAGLIILLLAAAPIILGPSLRQSTVGHILDWLNPFAISMNMLDAVIVDSQWAFTQQLLPLSALLIYAFAAIVILRVSSKRIEL